MTTTLESYLGRAYGAQVLSREPLAKVVSEMKAAMLADPDLAQAAADCLATLTGDVTDRCFVSTVKRDFLRSVVG